MLNQNALYQFEPSLQPNRYYPYTLKMLLSFILVYFLYGKKKTLKSCFMYAAKKLKYLNSWSQIIRVGIGYVSNMTYIMKNFM